MENNKKLMDWQEKFNLCKNSYKIDGRPAFDVFKDRWNQYNGDKTIGGGRESSISWRITEEIIESQIDSSIPIPKVTPKHPNKRTLRNAQVIVDMINAENDRLPTEMINDMDERSAKIDGGTIGLMEWDTLTKTHDTVGDISIRLLQAKQFIPQISVYDTDKMDYLFITFDDTRERLSRRYKVKVEKLETETVDRQISDANPNSDLVTQVIAFYMSDKGTLGCFSWAGDTILLDDDNYEARKDKVCAKCGKSQAYGEKVCICGCDEWVKRDKEWEYLTEDIEIDTGETDEFGQPVKRIIPHLSPMRDENGDYVYEDVEVPMMQPMVIDGVMQNTPVYEKYWDETTMQTMERPATKLQKQVRMIPTRIPYYYMHCYPIFIRKNISERDNVLGKSDCDSIKDFQVSVNRKLTKRDDVINKSGSVIEVPKGAKIELQDEALKVIESPKEFYGSIKVQNITSDTSQYQNAVQEDYAMATSVTGITKSYQGKPDSTASSGTAKQAQIAQAAGRLRSKTVMKNAAYADRYKLMFQFMLAYSDEPRRFATKDKNGQPTESVFNKYAFLEQDEFGNWYYDDEYLFSVDESGVNVYDKEFMLGDLRTDFQLGAYGNPADAETILSYWQEKEKLGYPNAGANIEKWQKKVEEQKMMQQQMQQQQMMGVQNGQMY